MRLTLAILTLLLVSACSSTQPIARECDRQCAMSLTLPDVGTRQ